MNFNIKGKMMQSLSLVSLLREQFFFFDCWAAIANIVSFFSSF